MAFLLEHSQPPSAPRAACFQQYFKPHPPAGNKSYLEIFLTSLEQFWSISASLRHHAQHKATAATCLRRAATRTSSRTAQRGWHKGQTPPVPPTDAEVSPGTPQQQHINEKPLHLVEGSVPACSQFQHPFSSVSLWQSGQGPFRQKSQFPLFWEEHFLFRQTLNKASKHTGCHRSS